MIRKWMAGCFLLVILSVAVSAAGAVTFKIATLSPEGSFWMQKMREGARLVAGQTDNEVQFKFYPGGVMGDDRVVLRKIRLGQLHGGAVVSGSLSDIYPDNQVYNLPIVFQTYEEVDYVRQRMDPVIQKGFEKGGLVTLGIAEGGFAYVMSLRPVRAIGDLIQQKLWIPDNDMTSLETVRTFGVSPIPLSIADVSAGLQTGLINTVTTSPIAAIALQWHTHVKYLTETPLLYVYGVLAVDGRMFQKLSPAQQQIVRKVMGNAFLEIDRQNRIDNEKALQALKDQGIQFVTPSETALAEWRQKAGEVAERLIEKGGLTREGVALLEKTLAEYRNSRRQGQ